MRELLHLPLAEVHCAREARTNPACRKLDLSPDLFSLLSVIIVGWPLDHGLLLYVCVRVGLRGVIR